MIMIIIFFMSKIYSSNISDNVWRNPPVMQPRLSSRNIFGNAREVVIEHAGEEYRLRLTRQGKLILTK